MEENVRGALMDLVAVQALRPTYAVEEVGPRDPAAVHGSVGRGDARGGIVPAEQYRIQERIRALNDFRIFCWRKSNWPPRREASSCACGPSWLTGASTETCLQSLTGIEAEESQARQMVNEIREQQATLAQRANRSGRPEWRRRYRWLTEIYQPRWPGSSRWRTGRHLLLRCTVSCWEHKMVLSERAARDVGHQAAIADFAQLLARRRGLPSGEAKTLVTSDAHRGPQPHQDVWHDDGDR